MPPGLLDTPRVQALRTALPCVFAAAAGLGMALTLASVVGTPAVDLGAFRSEGHDGLAIYLGQGLYHNPAGSGYTGLLYPPLMPFLLAALDELGVWNGWAVLVSVGATAALALLVAREARRAAGQRGAVTALGALGIGGIAVWLATSAVGLLYAGWTDELAWSFALGGLLAGARARDARGVALTIALFALAFWSKQTTAAAILAYGIWLLVLTARGARTRRFTAGLLVGLLAVNLIVLGGLAVLTGGWEFFFNFTLPTRQARIYGAHQFLADLLRVLAPPGLWAIAVGAGALGRGWRQRIRLDSPAALLALFAVIGVPLAMYFRSKQGGNPNQYFGVIWALGVLVALAWGASRTGTGRRPVDALVVVAILAAGVMTLAGTPRFDLTDLRFRYDHSVPADLRALGLHGGLFQPLYTDLTPGRVYPEVYNAADLLAADEQPFSIIDALLDRRFRYAETYQAALGAAAENAFSAYASAYGRYEANYFWKLDQLIELGYGPARGLPAGILERRSTPITPAIRDCFGPFELTGQSWSIRRGGGFWCHFAPDAITLTAAPSPLSELITRNPVTARGTVTLSAHPGAVVTVARTVARRVNGGWDVSAAGVKRQYHGARLTLTVDITAPTRLSVLATPGRAVTLDTRRLRLNS